MQFKDLSMYRISELHKFIQNASDQNTYYRMGDERHLINKYNLRWTCFLKLWRRSDFPWTGIRVNMTWSDLSRFWTISGLVTKKCSSVCFLQLTQQQIREAQPKPHKSTRIVCNTGTSMKETFPPPRKSKPEEMIVLVSGPGVFSMHTWRPRRSWQRPGRARIRSPPRSSRVSSQPRTSWKLVKRKISLEQSWFMKD